MHEPSTRRIAQRRGVVGQEFRLLPWNPALSRSAPLPMESLTPCPGIVPGLDVLDEHGNLRATSDFRSIYAGLLEQWLGTEAAGIIPDAGRVVRPQLVK
jgi:hypothetical protein